MFFTVVEVHSKLNIVDTLLLRIDKCTARMLFDVLEKYADDDTVTITVRKYRQ